MREDNRKEEKKIAQPKIELESNSCKPDMEFHARSSLQFTLSYSSLILISYKMVDKIRDIYDDEYG